MNKSSYSHMAFHRRGRPVYTYVMGVSGSDLVKIGSSIFPDQRVHAMRYGAGAKVPVGVDTRTITLLWKRLGDVEEQLHEAFSAHRVVGEWFDLTSLGEPLSVVQDAAREMEEKL